MPLGLTLNTVPQPELPPLPAVPYSVLPDKIKPYGLAPSLLEPGNEADVAVKLCTVVKVWAITRSDSISPRPAISTRRRKRSLRHVFIWCFYKKRPPQRAFTRY